MRYALADEALTNIAVGARLRRRLVGEFGFLPLPLRAVGEQVSGIARAHDAARVSARATREVSMVIQRRPHCSAT